MLALLLALSLTHVQDCAYARVDSLLSFLVTLSWYAAARSWRNVPPWRGLAVTGVVCGLTLATKYNAVPILLLPIAVALHQVRASVFSTKIMLQACAVCGSAVVAGFLLGTPEVLWRPAPLLHGLVFEAKHYAQGHIPYQAFGFWDSNFFYWPQYLGSLGFSWLPSLGVLAFVTALAWRGPNATARRGLGETYIIVTGCLLVSTKVRFDATWNWH